MGRSNKKVKSERINALRKQYDSFLEEDKKRKERNEYILGKLDKMVYSTALVPVRSKPSARVNIRRPSASYQAICQSNIPTLQEVQPSAIFKNQLTQNIPLHNVEETYLIQEISKNYILIPKLKSPVVNKYVPQATPVRSTGIMQDLNNMNEVHASQTSNVQPETLENADWKSKYEILNILKNEEKVKQTVQFADEQTRENTLNQETSLNNMFEKVVVSGNNDIGGTDIYSVTGSKYMNEMPEKDVPDKKLNYKLELDDEINDNTIVQVDPVSLVNYDNTEEVLAAAVGAAHADVNNSNLSSEEMKYLNDDDGLYQPSDQTHYTEHYDDVNNLSAVAQAQHYEPVNDSSVMARAQYYESVNDTSAVAQAQHYEAVNDSSVIAQAQHYESVNDSNAISQVQHYEPVNDPSIMAQAQHYDPVTNSGAMAPPQHHEPGNDSNVMAEAQHLEPVNDSSAVAQAQHYEPVNDSSAIAEPQHYDTANNLNEENVPSQRNEDVHVEYQNDNETRYVDHVEENKDLYVEHRGETNLNYESVLAEQHTRWDSDKGVDQTEVNDPNYLVAEDVNDPNKLNIEATDYVDYATENTNVQDLKYPADYQMKGSTTPSTDPNIVDKSIKEDEILDLSVEQTVEQEPQSGTTPVEESEKKEESADMAGMQVFENEQSGMYYSDNANVAYGYQQDDGTAGIQEYEQNEAYQQNVDFYENTLPQAFPVDVGENEEQTLMYDPSYHQQYENPIETPYSKEHTQDYENTEAYEKTHQDDLTVYNQPTNESVDQIETALDYEDGYAENVSDMTLTNENKI